MSLREELQRKQQRWMAERERELDRHEAQEALLGLGSKADDHRLLDRVTSQIAERLQVEMRLQNARVMQDGAVGDRVELLLERHLEAHTCVYHGQGRRPGRCADSRHLILLSTRYCRPAGAPRQQARQSWPPHGSSCPPPACARQPSVLQGRAAAAWAPHCSPTKS